MNSINEQRERLRDEIVEDKSRLRAAVTSFRGAASAQWDIKARVAKHPWRWLSAAAALGVALGVRHR